MNRRIVIWLAIGLVLVAALLILIMTRVSNGPALVFVKYVQPGQSGPAFAVLTLTNVTSDYYIPKVSAAWGNIFPAYFYREKPKHSWIPTAVHKAPAPTAELGASWSVTPEFFISGGGISTVLIPITPGTTPRKVGFDYFIRRRYSGKNALIKKAVSVTNHLRQWLKLGVDWRRQTVWCPTYLSVPVNGVVATNSANL